MMNALLLCLQFRYRVLVSATLLLLFGTLYSFRQMITIDTIKQRKIPTDNRPDREQIRNQTLGFQKILCINMPHRTDKRDAIVLGSSLTDLYVDWVDGVSAANMSPKAYPPRLDELHRPSMNPGAIGSWRAHMDAIQRVVSERLTTALILEDDVDWDVTLKTQLQEFALGSQAVEQQQQQQQEKTAAAEFDMPYGDDWDILWLGHCGMKCQPDQPFYMFDDPTAVPPAHLPHYFQSPAVHESLEDANQTRIVCRAGDGACVSAYAVTYVAAQKLLAALSVLPSDDAMPPGEELIFDLLIGRLCSSGQLKCVSSWPSITGSWQPPGSRSRQSDITDLQETKGRKAYYPGSSEGVTYSTMLNIPLLLDGGDIVPSSVDDVPNATLNFTDVWVGEGRMYQLNDDIIEEFTV